MDDSAEDELTVRPVTFDSQYHDSQVLVRAEFTGGGGKKYLGYLHWNQPADIESLQPVVFFDEEETISFWNGITQISRDDYTAEQQQIVYGLPLYLSLSIVTV
ncbi:hypothetical protein [Thalassomonas actiniarum]|uniref:Uncharacterized protein n=1 Tax=Thalassomonas actiniarum TaxID=485447 RepID=A0AAF0C682_9GAMM|nr:hypothetical protein [Thalassomonas actiniarum]WDE02338.1 hypothetical protein SG35_031810 [Thalassomonas actiniarum]